MKRRILKKRIYQIVSEAVDHVYIDPDTKDPDKKIEELLEVYEGTIEKVNEYRLVDGEKAVKAHFKGLKEDFNDKIAKILTQ